MIDVVRRCALGVLFAVLLGAAPTAAQQPSRATSVRNGALAACKGETVTAIDIRAHAPSSESAAADVWDKATEVTGARHVPTRASIVRAYLHVAKGRACTELDRVESERLLRAQPFIASAAIRVLSDGAGRVRLQVDVVDEFPLVVAGSVSRGTLSSLLVGTQNLDGRGLFTSLSFSRGFAYRTGFGVHVVQYGAFGRPDFLSFDAERGQHGDRLVVELAEPFLTVLQRHAFHASGGSASDLAGLMTPSGEEVALFTRRAFWDAGWITRLGIAATGRTVGVAGIMVRGEDIRSDGGVVVVSDTGLVSATDPALEARYPAFAVARVAAITGMRHLRFLTVSGFDALRAEQDIGIGVQLGLLAGPSVWASRGAGDVFASGDLYAGVGDERSFFAARLLAEARANRQSRRLDGAVSSVRFSWYGIAPGASATIVSVEGAALNSLAFPAQLSFRDADGGVRGYSAATASGGERAVVRAEQRFRLSRARSRADIAAALFADAGKIWAGDAPYGVTSPVRAALGLSLLGAWPSSAKRTYRVDVAFPLNPERGGSKVEFRLSSSDRTRGFWLEPRDVASARTGATPATLLKW